MSEAIKTIEKRCGCGLPLHYSDAARQHDVEELVKVLGETMPVTIIGGRSWLVPRHYIALHGLEPSELPTLALTYGFKEVIKSEPGKIKHRKNKI